MVVRRKGYEQVGVFNPKTREEYRPRKKRKEEEDVTQEELLAEKRINEFYANVIKTKGKEFRRVAGEIPRELYREETKDLYLVWETNKIKPKHKIKTMTELPFYTNHEVMYLPNIKLKRVISLDQEVMNVYKDENLETIYEEAKKIDPYLSRRLFDVAGIGLDKGEKTREEMEYRMRNVFVKPKEMQNIEEELEEY